MIHSRRPKRDLASYQDAMNRAHVGEAPQPLCKDRPEEFVDYGYPLPTRRQAADLCRACPFKTGYGKPGDESYIEEDICLKNAKHRGQQWGIWGGLVFVAGRQAALMSHDDERLRDPDLDFSVRQST